MTTLLDAHGRSLGDIAETRNVADDATQAFFAGTEVPRARVTKATAYEQQTWVYAAVTVIARTLASMPFDVIKGNDTIVDSPSDPIASLFRRPSARKSRYELFFNTIAALELNGNAIWWLDLSGSNSKQPAPLAIHVIDPNRIKPKLDRDTGALLGYELTGGRKKRIFDIEEIIHFQYPNPRDPTWGVGPLAAAMLSVKTDIQAAMYNQKFFENSAQPGGLLISKSRRLTPQQSEQVRASFNSEHLGIDNAHRTAVLAGDFDYKQLGLGHRDMQFLEQRKFSREQICTVFGVPDILISHGDGPNFATANVKLRIFAEHNWLPKARYIEDHIRSQFFKRFKPEYEGRFDLTNAPGLREDVAAKIERAKVLFDMGVPLNDAVAYAGVELPKYKWGETWWVPATVVPAGEAPPAPKKDATKNVVEVVDKRELLNDPLRERYWRSFIKRFAPLENRFHSRMKRHFFEMRQEILGELMDHAERAPLTEEIIAQLLGTLDGFNRLIVEWASPMIQEGMETGGKMVLGELGIDDTFTIQSDLGLSDFNDRANLIVGINETVFTHIGSSLREGLDLGENINDLAARIRNVFDASANRARTIARTEIGTAVSSGRNTSMKQQGVEKTEWITARDAEVRSSHVLLDGTTAKIDEPFNNGLRYPLDPEGPAAEIINCRCVAIPKV